MSVLLRPDGDAIAKSFGTYMTRSEVINANTRDKFDVLCAGRIHYLAKIVEIDKKGHGRLHFCKWNEKYDHVGDLTALYIATEGCYSTGTLNAHNQHIDPNDATNTTSRRASRDGTKEDKNGVTYAEKSRYDADFLSKPYRNDRKRRSLDASTTVDATSEASSVFPDAAASRAVHIVSTDNIENSVGEVLDGEAKRQKVEPSAAIVDEDAPITATAPATAASADAIVASSAAGDSSTGAGAGSGVQQLQLQHRLLPSFAMDVVSAIGSSHSDINANNVSSGGVGASVTTQHQHHQQHPPSAHSTVPLIHALSGPSTLGGKTMACWKEYYRRLLSSSHLQEYKDTATAMDWLDKHLDGCKARGQISGKVRGPVGLICMAIDTPSAIMLEHAIGQQHLLAFVVDRMQDQTYLENALIHTQKLCVKVLYSGTKTRFSGYKKLPEKVAFPIPGAELSNLADRMYCPQLIRNCLHSSGCTAEYKIGGFCANKSEVVRHMDDVFSTKDSMPSVYLYEALAKNVQTAAQAALHDGVDSVAAASSASNSSVEIALYRCSDASLHRDKHYSVSQFDSTAVPVQDPAHRLLFSGEEQLRLADTVQYSNIAVLPAVMPVSSSSKPVHSSNVVNGAGGSHVYHKHAPKIHGSAPRTALPSGVNYDSGGSGGRVNARAVSSASSQAAMHGDISCNHHDQYYNGALHTALSTSTTALTTHKMHILPSKYAALKATGMVVNSVGTAAVWNVLTGQPGLWFRDKNALQLDLVNNYKYEAIPELSSRDKDWGYFVPLKHFIFTPEGGHITPVFLHFRNTEPLLMQPTAPTEAVEAADAPARETELEGLPTTPAMSAVAFGALMAMAQASSPTALVAPAPPASPQATQTAGEDVSTVTPEGVQVVASGAQVPVASDRVRLLSDAVSDAAETQKPAVSADDLEETAALATVVADKMDVVHTSSADAADHSPGDGVVHEAELAGVEFAGKAVAGESKEDLDEDGDEEEDLRSTTTADELQQADQSNAISGKELPGGTESTVDNASLTVPVLATTEAIAYSTKNGTMDGVSQEAVTHAREATSGDGPVLALHTKPGLFGLVFATKEVFQQWHLAQWPNAQPNILPEIPLKKVAFVTLASMRMDRDYYDLKLLKLKRLCVFRNTPPVCSADSRIARELARPVLSTLLPSSPLPAPLPLSLLTGFDGDMLSSIFNMNTAVSSGGMAGATSSATADVNTGVEVAPPQPPALSAGPLQQTTADWRALRSQLNITAIIANLQRSIDSTHLHAAEMRRRNINPQSFQALLRAQIKLAEATKLMLG